MTAQSSSIAAVDDSDSRLRGKIIHRVLDCLTRSNPRQTADLAGQIAAEFGFDRRETLLASCLSEAESLLQQPSLQTLLAVRPDNQAYNEVPVNFYDNGRPVSGVIDRLLLANNEAIIIDYKTNRHGQSGHAGFHLSGPA